MRGERPNPEYGRCRLCLDPIIIQCGGTGLAVQKEGTIMAVMFSDPFSTLFNLQQMLDASRSSSWLDAGPSGVGAYPPINVFRQGDDFVVLLELPGINKSDLSIQV